MRNLIDNEKLILSLIKEHGSLSKRGLCDEGGIGWATVSKLVSRLIEDDLIIDAGEENQRVQGKNPSIYKLSDKQLSLAIDIEKRTTTTALISLSGKIINTMTTSTTDVNDRDSHLSACQDIINQSIRSFAINKNLLIGVGIGMPFPDYVPREEHFDYLAFQLELSQQTGLDCRVENNIVAFTDYIRQQHNNENFLLMAIRSGVGGGLVINNQLYKGIGNAAEVGHIFTGGKKRCGCGQIGCLETEVSLKALTNDNTNLDNFLSLISEDKLNHITSHLAFALTQINKVLDIPKIILCSHFESETGRLLQALEEKNNRLSNRLTYLKINDNDFIRSSAQLQFSKFFG